MVGGPSSDALAIKHADVGIAEGVGFQVCHDFCNTILLDDNLSHLPYYIEEGRLLMDNLKKCIVYTLASNIPEVVPFILAVVFQIPVPFTAVMVLIVDLGIDLFPAIALAYEEPEYDLMEMWPRNTRRDFLVNRKLISYAYLQIGIIQAAACLFTYFYIMNDYGFRPSVLYGLATEKGFVPEPEDIYTPGI